MADGFASPSLSPALNGEEISRRQFSVADLDAMFDAEILSRDEKLELIDGELFKMNSQMMPHGVLKMRLCKALMTQISDSFNIWLEMTVQLSPNSLVDPDIMITTKLPFERRYVKRNEALFIVEVADTSIGYDLGAKAKLYSRAEIAEYWVVDINDAQTWVHCDPSEQGYVSIVKVPFGDSLASISIAGVSVVVADLLT